MLAHMLELREGGGGWRNRDNRVRLQRQSLAAVLSVKAPFKDLG